LQTAGASRLSLSLGADLVLPVPCAIALHASDSDHSRALRRQKAQCATLFFEMPRQSISRILHAKR
jgi:predicted nucleotidyltransferase